MRHINEIWNVYICLFNIKGHILLFIKHMYVIEFYCCVYMSFKKKSCVHMSYKKKIVFICHLILSDIYIQA